MVHKKIAVSLVLAFLFNILLSQIAFASDEQEIYHSLLDGKRVLKQRDYMEEETPTVYLTFDDGPSYLTESILEILKEENVKATFFVLGQSAGRYKETLKKMVEEGHSIGNHTFSHDYNKLYNSFSSFWEEIQKTEEMIYDITGIRTSLVRTPGGTYQNWDSFYFYYMDQADYLIYDWNVDSGDSRRRGVTKEEILSSIKKSKLGHRLVVLLHDGSGHENTVKALTEIIHYYKAKGYQFKPLTNQVEPVLHASTPIRWNRLSEFDLRAHFTRKTPGKELAERLFVKKMNKVDERIIYQSGSTLSAAEPQTQEKAKKTFYLSKEWIFYKMSKTLFTIPFLIYNKI